MIDIYLVYCLVSLVLATTSQILLKKDGARSEYRNQTSNYIKVIIEKISNSKIIYFSTGLILLILFKYNSIIYLIVMFIYFLLVYVISKNQKFFSKLFSKILNKNKKETNHLGIIIGFKSNDIFTVKIYDNRKISMNDSVIFRSCFCDCLLEGIVIEEEYTSTGLNVTIMKIGESDSQLNININEVWECSNRHSNEIIGFVEKNTDVQTLYFKYIPNEKIQIGDLISIVIDGKTILYQVINGKVETQTSNKNDTYGYIIGSASQIGVWNDEEEIFENYDWVAEYNKPLRLYKII